MAPISHAVLEASVLGEIHVESESLDHGQQAHDEYLCQVCRLVDFGGVKSHHASFGADGPAQILIRGACTSKATLEVTALSHPSRAPPVS